jgi:acetyl-CoA carboxylase biotin carboxylase subunit
MVKAPEELRKAFPQASAEAQAAFGDGGMFIEKCIQRPRHVEVQVMADEHGSVVHLFERECSIQRRKQKLIEEAPSPSISPGVRERLCASALAVAAAVDYVNAGTVEFLVDVDRDVYYFIKVNSRIQVEHGLTETVTGIDLVAEQLRVAGGLPLSFGQEDIRCEGTALEFRINAEDPTKNFLPSPGKITHMLLPGGPGVRVDTGVMAGCSVQPLTRCSPSCSSTAATAPRRWPGRGERSTSSRSRASAPRSPCTGRCSTGPAWPRRRRTPSPWRRSSRRVARPPSARDRGGPTVSSAAPCPWA